MVKIRQLTVLILRIIPVLLVVPLLTAQNPQTKQIRKKIELIFAEQDILVRSRPGEEIHHMVGNVQFRHNDVLMFCDSAHYSPGKQQLTAFSQVHIKQGDTLDLYGNYLFYDGITETAVVRENVELIDKESHLYTDAIDYDVRNRIARYSTGGRITNAGNTLTSIRGVYYVQRNIFNFKDSVKIHTPEYLIEADTMDYNTKTEVSFFIGPTKLTGDSLKMYSENGWFDTRNNVTSVWKNAVIDNMQQIVYGDSLFYNDSTGYGEAYRNVTIQDTTNNLIVEGDFAWYYKQPERFLVTQRATFIQVSEEDSLFLHADTISAITVTDSSSYRLMRAYHQCRIFSRQLQAKCDSLSYSFRDSVIRFYTEPVLWSEEYQLVSDSMAIFTKNRQAERLELYNGAFVVSMIDTSRYNQIKGRTLTGYFEDNELSKIEVNGNGESIYFLIDGNQLTGVNQSRCARIEAFVKDGRVVEIIDNGNPEGVIDPPDLNSDPAELKLEGFIWLDHLRPKRKSDIYRN